MAKAPAKFEETKHYVNDPKGPAIVRFYPGNHGYFVTDPVLGVKSQRTGGATSITGMLAKGEGLMKWPMWEMSKYLKTFFETTTVKELVDSELTIEDILRAGRDQHTNKSDRGKSVGTDAHSWVEAWSKEALRVYALMGLTTLDQLDDPKVKKEFDKHFQAPEIPDVEDIAAVLKRRYIEIIKDLKPKELDDWRSLPKLIAKDIDMQEAIWIEATMVRNSTLAAKEWIERHDIRVYGAEDTVYSRSLFTCGKYDADWQVTCSKKCGFCYLNGSKSKKAYDVGASEFPEDHKFTGRYIVDFKSTNASRFALKGIYPEYVPQCGVYDLAIIEEFPERKYDGYLILNGSKVQQKDKDGNEVPLFNSHFSFDRERTHRAVKALVTLKEDMHIITKEVENSA